MCSRPRGGRRARRYSAASMSDCTGDGSSPSMGDIYGRPGPSAATSRASIRLTSQASGRAQALTFCSERTIMKPSKIPNSQLPTSNSQLTVPSWELAVGRWTLVILVLGIVSPVGAQQLDARWAPFAGCWELVDGGATSCVAPSTAGAVTLTTIVEGKPVLEQTIIADGAAHALSETDCTGSQRHEWSRDGRKLFGRAELRCAGQPVRTVSALSLMTGDNSWLDVQAIEIAGSTSLR